MSQLLKWDQTGDRRYKTGVDHGVVYPVDANGTYPEGYAWNGLTAVNETPSGGEANDIYADNIKYLTLMSAEQLGLTIEAYYSPEEFDECDGTAIAAKGVKVHQQSRRGFGFSWRGKIGNDVNEDLGYELKLAYGCKASPSEEDHQTVNDSPEAASLSWEVNTTPVAITAINPATGKAFKPTALLTINSIDADPDKLAALEAILYGTEGTPTYNEATVVSPVYTEVSSPAAGASPKDEGWYERSGSAGAYVYTLSTDTSVDSGKTYYELTTPGSNPKSEGWYERSGSTGAYVYTLTTDTSAASGKTYYVKTIVGEVAARLPLPDEVFSILADG